ncbi:hypothetical protein [Bifidobacterium vansinderenii]|uniref:Uncharacterized protein n=1 Tax=Bifidobacterium vansinderenii TaxID=1984871 RepID=A0A229W213_9BIFI|nr:hypothetical protein [Bifidobacterium vansinderenii]OXN01730.1 hypothetical protein Tam10B_0003 [Bifidobacterium vansinderenii]
MKTSYRLIGLFWDHRPESSLSLEPIDYDPLYLEAGHPDCLFDFAGKHRYITLTELLSVDSQHAADSLSAKLTGSTGIAVIYDFNPTFQGSTACLFFRHRVKQALKLLEDMVPDVSVKLMKAPELGLAA